MQKARSLLTLAALISLLSACSSFEFPWVHKYDIQQGNIITQEMIDQLKPGMTKRQVRYIMGPPLLHDTFTEDRWDYYYGIRKGNGEKYQERVTIFFEDDKLSYFTGDFKPSPAAQDDPATEPQASHPEAE